MTPRFVGLLWIAALALAAVWALWPLERNVPTASPSAALKLSDSRMPVAEPFDVDAFRTPLWTAPPPPPPAPAPPATPPPIPPTRLLLLAIITGDDGVRRATLYDPDIDRVESLASGERRGAAVIDNVEAQAVTITDAAGTRTLRLRPDEPDSASGGGGG